MDEQDGTSRAYQQRIHTLEREVSRLRDAIAHQERHPATPTPACEAHLEHYRSVLEYLSDWVWEIDTQQRYTYASPRICEMLGYAPDDVLGKTPFDFMSPEEAARVGAFFAPITARHEAFQLLENTLLHQDGHPIVVETSGVPLFDTRGQFCGYRGIDRDVTARKVTEKRLADSEARYRLLVEGSADVFYYIHDASYRFTYLSPSVMNVLGYTPEELCGKPFTMLLPGVPSDEHVLEATDTAIATGKRLAPYEAVVHTRDGETVVLEIMETPVIEDGMIVGLQGFARDVTARKQATDALRESEQRFYDLFEHVHLLAVMLDVQGKVTFCNDYLLDCTGWMRDEVIGHDWLEFIPEDAREGVQGVFHEFLAGDATRRYVTNEILTRTGARRLIAWNNVVLHAGDSQITGVAAMGEDITDRTRFEAALRESEARYRLMVEGSEQVFFYQHDPAYRLSYLSPSIASVLGYAPSELLGHAFTELLTGDPSDRIAFDLTDATLRTGERQAPYTVVIRRKDGRPVVVEVVESPIVRDGAVMGIQGFARDITERSHADAALRESRERLAEAQQLAHLGNYVIAVSSGEVVWSAEMYRILGLAPEAWTPTIEGFMEHVLQDDREHVRRVVHDAIDQLAPFEIEFRVVRRDGTQRTVQSQGRVRTDAAGNATELFGTVQDITERTAIEAELHSTVHFLTTLLETLPTPFFYKDTAGRYLGANPAFADAMGMPLAALVGKTIFEVAPEELAALYHARDEELLQHPGTQRYEANVRYADGTLHDVIFSKATFTRADGTLAGLLGVMSDVTALKHAEEEARRSEATLQSVFLAAPIGVGVVKQRIFTMVNEQLLKMTGYTREELLGQDARLFYENDKEYARVGRIKYREIAAHGVGRVETRFVRKDGKVIEIILSSTPLDPDDLDRGVVFTAQDITLRKRMEHAVRESEERLRLALNAANEGLWDWNIATGDVYYSPRYYTMLGYRANEFPATFAYWADHLLHPDDRAHTLAVVNDCVTQRLPAFEIESRMRTKSGQWRWILARGNIVAWTAHGVPLRMVGTHVDVTELRQTVEKLRDSNRALRMLTESNQSLLRALDEKTLLNNVCQIIVEFGGYHMAWIGYAEIEYGEKVLRPAAWAGHEAGYLHAVQVHWDESLLGKGPGGVSVRVGAPAIVEDIATDPGFAPWRDEALQRGYRSSIAMPLFADDTVFGVLIIYSDVPRTYSDEEIRLLTELAGDVAFGVVSIRSRLEHRIAEEQVRSQRALLSAVIDILPFPIAIYSTDHQLIQANKASVTFSHMSVDTWWDVEFLTPDSRTPVPKEDWPLMRSLHGEVIPSAEGIFRFADGREVPVLIHTAPVYVGEELVAAVVAFQDVSPLKAANRAKDEFLAVLSHELKTPLTSIIGWTHIAFENAESARKALEVIDRNAERQRRILEDLLDVSKIVYGKLYLKVEPFNLWEIVVQCVEDITRVAEEHRLHIAVEAPAEPLTILGDPSRLRQVLANLLDNAIKFTNPGGTITLRGRQEAGMAVVTVQDTGRGIAPEHLQTLFRPFLQIQREEAKGGLGLGLALVRGIVDLHHGRVYAASAGLGQGSTVTVEIPLLPPPAD